MGKRNFTNFYNKISSELISKFGKVTGKISLYGDVFDPTKSYAGAIVYAIDGKFSWKCTGGRASGQNGRSFYVIIQCTDNWPTDAFKRAGEGKVHDYLIKNVFGIAYSDEINGKKRICCGGFAFHAGRLKFSSVWLNQTNQMGCEHDGTKYLSDAERVLVKHCFEQYKLNGIHKIFEIPTDLDEQLSGKKDLQNVPPMEG